jgi:hypothetical protein
MQIQQSGHLKATRETISIHWGTLWGLQNKYNIMIETGGNPDHDEIKLINMILIFHF